MALKTPYDHIEDAGYGEEIEAIRDLLKNEEWYDLPMQCTPKTLAAGAVYFLYQTNDDYPDKTQAEVAEEFNTTPMSVRNGWKHLGIFHGLLDHEEVTLPHET